MGILSMSDLMWSLPLFDNLYLSMQGQNIMLVDVYLRDMEKQLLRELHRQETAPMPDTMFVSALSQMWIFGTYELLRTWRQLVNELKKGSKPPQEPSGDQIQFPHLEETYFREQATRLQSDSGFAVKLDKAFQEVEPLFRRIEALRMNLAKHEVPKKKGHQRAIAPGYGRIDEGNGSISWFVDLGNVSIDGKTYREQDTVSRRSIGDSLRRIAVGHLLEEEDEDELELEEEDEDDGA